MFKDRLKKLQEALLNYSCDNFVVTGEEDLYYMTGLELSAGKLLVKKDQAILFVDGRYYERCKKECPYDVQQLEKWKELKLTNLGFNSESTTYSESKDLQTICSDLIPLENPLKFIRAIKGPEEIKKIRSACVLGSKGMHYAISLLKEGIVEEEIAKKLQIFWLEQGGEGVAFEPIIAFGANSALPHYRAGKAVYKKDEIALFDVGVILDHYRSDMTRTVINDNGHPELKKIYAIVEEAKHKAQALAAPGTSIGDLDAVAREYIASQGYGDYFIHSLGHGIGLETHEWPVIRSKGACANYLLQPGMVITIEPGIYLPDLGGVRLEDTILITEKGHEVLT